jgi:CTP-dependent riboflavin kinase
MKKMIMNYQLFALGALALALLTVSVPALAAKKAEKVKVVKAAKAATHVGKVVSITGSKLVMTSKDGKEHSHTLAITARFTCDGKVCKAQDLKAGTKIRVTTQTSDAKVATRIEAIVKNRSFADTHDGKIVSITGNKLVMTSKGGKKHSHTLAADVKVTCDGKVCKFSDLKPEMRIRVTSESDAPHTVIRVEALDKNLKFASL